MDLCFSERYNFNLFQVNSQRYHLLSTMIKMVMRMAYDRIRELREDHDLRQIDVAKILKMSQTGYSKYETGENDIPTAVLIALASFYHVSVDYLLGRTSIMDPYPDCD